MNNQFDIPAIGYYLVKSNEHLEDVEIGTLVYVVPGTKETIALINGDQYTYEPEEMGQFWDSFEFAPNGSELRQQIVAKLMAELEAENTNFEKINDQYAKFQPYASPTGELSSSTSLTTLGVTDIQGVKKKMAETRNMILHTQKNIKAKTTQLKAFLEEQSTALMIKAKQLQAVMEKAEEAIWSINLYLGKNESVYRLHVGKPAPADQKIAIRQKVLYMDEECALHPNSEGIDAESIEAFDKWIMKDPSHLTQVLPETKGIVALHIKRNKKNYNDPWRDTAMNDANLNWTYFLIRNGDSVYRVYVDIVVGKSLIPTEKEYTDLFLDTKHDAEDTYLKPGSDKYMKALEASDAKSRHYLRILLVLQGLLDRTKIFHPMPVERINICNPSGCEEYLTLVYDNENNLGDGKMPFAEWRQLLNDELQTGNRIIGNFDYSAGLYGGEYRETRIYPRTASYPESATLYTIEDEEVRENGRAMIIRYDRNERYRDVQVRARCILYRDDKFILNFDAAKLEDIQYYLGSRIHRHDYQNMIPVLEIARDLKIKEAKDEAPFRLLLIGELMKLYQFTQEEVEPKIDEIIKWWKFKNRTHRALLSDDTKAFNMIVTEYGLRLRQEGIRNRAGQATDVVLDAINQENREKTIILIAHKSNNQYVAYVAENDVNVWVTEQTWKHNRVTQEVRLVDSKPWKLVDNRHQRWQILQEHVRWQSWVINPPMAKVLTDAEIDELIKAAIVILKLDKTDLFSVYYDNDFELTLWYLGDHAEIPTELILSSSYDEPKIKKITITWKRTVDGVKCLMREYDSRQYCVRLNEKTFKEHGCEHVVQIWHDNIAALNHEFDEFRAFKKKREKLSDKYDYVQDDISEYLYELEVAKARKEFDAEFGDPELWEDHLASLKISRNNSPNHLWLVFNLHAERDLEVVGKSLMELYEHAIELNGQTKEETEDDEDHSWKYGRNRRDIIKIPEDLPLNYIVPPPPPPEPEEEEPDNELDDLDE